MPSGLLVVVHTEPRSVSVAVTFAAGIAAPDGSITFPVMAAITCWPCAGGGVTSAVKTSSAAATENLITVCDFMETPLLFVLKAFMRDDPRLMLSLFLLYVQFTTVAKPLRAGSLPDRTCLSSIIYSPYLPWDAMGPVKSHSAKSAPAGLPRAALPLPVFPSL